MLNMDLAAITKVGCFYVLVAAGETLNGIVRTVCLNKYLGRALAKKISLLSALLLCLLICYFYVPTLSINTDKGLLLLGVSLATFMLAFDIALAKLVMKSKLSKVIDEFNVRKGNLLGIGMIVMAFCPLLSAKIPRIP